MSAGYVRREYQKGANRFAFDLTNTNSEFPAGILEDPQNQIVSGAAMIYRWTALWQIQWFDEVAAAPPTTWYWGLRRVNRAVASTLLTGIPGPPSDVGWTPSKADEKWLHHEVRGALPVGEVRPMQGGADFYYTMFTDVPLRGGRGNKFSDDEVFALVVGFVAGGTSFGSAHFDLTFKFVAS